MQRSSEKKREYKQSKKPVKPMLLGIFLLTTLLVGFVFAVHKEGVFELDGNIVSESDVLKPGVDWDQICSSTFTRLALPSGAISSFCTKDGFILNGGIDGNVADPTTFTTGSKDTLDITPGWQCTPTNNPTDKDDLIRGGGAIFVDKNGHLLMYLFINRLANNGAGEIAFWILQDRTVGCPQTGGTASFTGHHVNGDLLIISEFTVGGTITALNVFKWFGGAIFDNDTSTSKTDPILKGVDCDLVPPATPHDPVCAKVNNATITSPWPTQSKTGGICSSPPCSIPTSEFYEMGIDLTEAVPGATCFATVVADTRTSPSLTATLKDYLVGQLPTCGSLQGDKFEDLNANGINDTGEPLLSGWTVNLYNSTGSMVGTTVTNATGDYKFTDLVPGTYIVCEVLPAGWTQSFPSSGPSCPGGTVGYSVNILGGTTVTHRDFGNFVKGEIHGTKFIDLNGNGVKDAGEGCPAAPDPNNAGCQGVTVHLDGTDGMGNPVHLTTTTDSNGNYQFTGITPGTYTVTIDEPSGFQCSYPNSCNYNVIIVSGQVVTNRDFGDYSFAEIHGTKFIDLNFNGVQDAGEGCPASPDVNNPGCEGVTVHLDGTDGLGNVVHLTTTTDSSGDYAFLNLRPGVYAVTVNEPSGFFCSFPSSCSYTGITLQSDQVVNDRNFGDYSLGEIHGVKFIDLNGNGAKDTGEDCPAAPDVNNAGCEGVTVHLDGSDGMGNAVHLTATTDSSGAYAFTDLKPGSYTVTVDEPSGFFCSFPTPCTYSIVLQSDQIITGRNFGDYSLGEVHGVKFIDSNGNGVKDLGEGCPAAPDPDNTGCEGITVHLDGTDGTGAAVHLTTTTDANGAYAFTGLKPGSYTVTVDEPSGFFCTFPSSCSYSITLQSDQVFTGKDFGDISLGEIHGTKIIDQNGNGVIDAGEGCPAAPDPDNAGCEGVTIHLDGTDGMGNAVHLTTTTDSSGSYQFPGLKPGSYTLTLDEPSGFICSFPASCSYSITLTSNQVITGKDFADYSLGEIHGVKFIDLNGNGVQDVGEACPAAPDVNNAGCEGVTVHLDGTDGMGNAVHMTTTTDSSGAYAFTGLRPGTYTVTVDEPSGFTCSFPSGCSYSTTLTSNQIVYGRNFGDYSFAEIHGTKFIDLNFNGVQDAGEGCPAAPDPDNAGCQGITVHLDGTDGFGNAVHLTTTTDSNGNYAFTGLNPGLYTVTIDEPSGFFCSFPSACSYTGITLQSDQVVNDRNFGDYSLGEIHGVKYIDLSGNNIGCPAALDPNNAGCAGVTVHLDGTDGMGNAVHLTTTTDSSGAYAFTGLKPGTYTVTIVEPSGFICSFPASCSYSITLTSNQIVTGANFGDKPPSQGCTPGFWKNHLSAWGPTGYSPYQKVGTVWPQASAYTFNGKTLDQYTLLEALSFPGGTDTNGAAQILLRVGVAALLNAASPNISYPLSASQVISQVGSALSSGDRTTMLKLANQLDAFNNLPCPLGGPTIAANPASVPLLPSSLLAMLTGGALAARLGSLRPRTPKNPASREQRT